jgi:hypothetical protein
LLEGIQLSKFAGAVLMNSREFAGTVLMNCRAFTGTADVLHGIQSANVVQDVHKCCANVSFAFVQALLSSQS